MISLYTTPSLWGLPSLSPPCMKLETWLRIAKLPHQKITEIKMEKAPKGKIPFIEYQGTLIGYSTLIIEMFKEKEAIDLDESLTATERAISLAFRRMLKENTYWGMAHVRYGMEENWQIYRETIADMGTPNASPEEREQFVKEIHELFRSQMHAQGMGRHSDEEIVQITCADFQSLSDFLAEKPFLMGNKPTTLDATAYAYIGNLIKPPFVSQIVDYVKQLKNLCQYYERMSQEFFSDLV